MNDNALGEETPIIIKRKKVVKGDDHHGGAWKVAYADFVTAMMAFFLLMWLLNATTEDQRKGLADYFNPSIPISRISGGGSDGLNGSSIFTEETLAEMGTGASRQKSAGKSIENLSEEALEGRLQELKDAMSKADKSLSEHVDIKLSPEGIVLELVDSADESLFAVGNSTPNDLLVTLLTTVAGSFDGFGNDLKIVGHTDNRQFRRAGGYNNWNLSSDRALAARQILSDQNFDMDRIREVSGRADTEPLVIEDPSAPQNRRVSIVILTQ